MPWYPDPDGGSPPSDYEAPPAVTCIPTVPEIAKAFKRDVVTGILVEREGVKLDSDKVDMALVPAEAIEQIAAAFTFGAKKYSANNWRKGFAWTRVVSAGLRHMYAWLRGEDKDPESGLSHLAHAGACVCFLLTFEATKTGTDDRYKVKEGTR